MAVARRWQWGKSSLVINTIAAERVINETDYASAQGSKPNLPRPGADTIEALPWVRARRRSVPCEPGVVRPPKNQRLRPASSAVAWALTPDVWSRGDPRFGVPPGG